LYPHFGVPGTTFTGGRSNVPTKAAMNSEKRASARSGE
jgi:hypothetical protein